MSTYTPVPISFNPFDITALERVGKFFVSGLVMGAFSTLIVLIIVSALQFAFVMGASEKVSIGVGVVLGLIGILTIYTFGLSLYENWRGCNMRS